MAIVEFSASPTDRWRVLQAAGLTAARSCNDVADLRLSYSSSRECRVRSHVFGITDELGGGARDRAIGNADTDDDVGHLDILL
jgi:hypothetical protein